MNEKFNNVFNCELLRDAGRTNRLEVTIYLDSKDASGEGILVHSKQNGDGFPRDNWDKFLERVTAGLEGKKA